jgi:hypothetical protein
MTQHKIKGDTNHFQLIEAVENYGDFNCGTMLGLNFVYYISNNVQLSHSAQRENDEAARLDAPRPSLNKTTKGNRINFTPFLEPFSYTPGDESARADF